MAPNQIEDVDQLESVSRPERGSPIAGGRGWRPMPSTSMLVGVGGLLVLATAILLWLGYRATAAQSRSDQLLADRRAGETLALLIAALDRDMKGAQLSVLLQLSVGQFLSVGAADLASQASTAFGRFPYMETIFVWRGRRDLDTPFVLNRADRPPPWDTTRSEAVVYPVVTRHGHPVVRHLIDQVHAAAPFDKRFFAFEPTVAGTRYQVVVHPLFETSADPPRLVGMIGYTVNLDWVREHYFHEIVAQVSAIAGEGQTTGLTITDAAGTDVAGAARTPGAVTHLRRFPLAFYDSRLTGLAEAAPTPVWTASARAVLEAGDPAAVTGQRLFMLMALAALASIVALVVIARAMQARAEIAAMKADFVSTVTHELKTPLSLMRLVADALVSGRYRDPDKVPEYGELLSAEVRRMTHLIDNLLSYARLSNVFDGARLGSLDVAELVAAVAADWTPRLAQQSISLEVTIDHEPMALVGDPTALQQALNNLIDNAVKYSPARDTRIALRARRDGSSIAIDVEDRGSGIDPDDLPRVKEKFYRGRGSQAPGSGLGLAIVDRVVRNHGGSLQIRRREGGGTTVTIVLPAA